jgi:hypothetical protein
MASQLTPTSTNTFRTIPGRNVTRRWKEANTVDYGGDGWGDDEYSDPTMQDPRGQGLGSSSSQLSYQNPPAQYHPSDRSATMRSIDRPSFGQSSTGRRSFDQGDERRNFASHVSGFQEGPYPTALRQPFPEPQHDNEYQGFEPQMHDLRGPPLLHIQTNARSSSRERGGPYSAPYYGPDSRMNQHPDPRAGPFSAAIPHSGSVRSQSGSRPGAEVFGRHESPARPGSRASQSSSPARQQLPPRKSSLSQENPPPDVYAATVEPLKSGTPPSNATVGPKPLPFLRPIDIWKRHEEEQNERRLQESSKPSFDSSTGKDRGGSVPPDSKDVRSSENPSNGPDTLVDSTEKDQTPPLKTVLDPVVERKSEYGFENILQQATPKDTSTIPPSTAPDTSTIPPSTSPDISTIRPSGSLDTSMIPPSTAPEIKDSDPASATSEYSNRPDPVTTASLHSSPSVQERQGPLRELSMDPMTTMPPLLPTVRVMSGFGSDFFPGGQSGQTEEASVAPAIPTKEVPAVPSKDSPASSMKDTSTITSQSTTVPTSLHHNTSHGYRSMVEQALEESQREPPTPISAADTLPRSNSASTYIISPIVSRSISQPMLPVQMSQTPTPDEPTDQSPFAATPAADADSQEEPPPVPFKHDYRRDNATPIPNNSPARKLVNVMASYEPKAEPGTKLSATPNVIAANPNQGSEGPTPSISVGEVRPPEDRPSRFDKPLPPADQASPDARSASTDYRDLPSQRKQFNARMGITTGSPLTPGAPSPISRSDSPGKGTVRDIAERLESRSGRSSPVVSDSSRPMQNRMESFRPSIPGGWQSSSTNTPQQGSRAISPEPTNSMRPEMRYQTETTESQIPRAGPPTSEHQDNTTTSAFAAFSGYGPPQIQNVPNVTHRQIDDESQSTQSVSRDEPNNSEIHESASVPPIGLAHPSLDSHPPPPLPKDTPREFGGPQSTEEYFPAPLKTNRSAETRATGRSSLQTDHAQDISPNEENNDRLRQEIEQSLTPRSSQAVPAVPEQPGKGPVLEQAGVSGSLPDRYPGDNALPQKESYWNGSKNAAAETVSGENSVKGNPAKSGDDYPKPGFLEQRFSWETEQDPSSATLPQPPSNIGDIATPTANQDQDPGFSTGSPETIRASDRAKSPGNPEASSSDALAGPSAAAAFVAVPLAVSALTPPSSDAPSTPFKGKSPGTSQTPVRDPGGINQPSTSFPMGSSPSSTVHAGQALPAIPRSETQEIPFRDILSMKNPDDKMRAYSANRLHFTASDGRLQRWLQFMGQKSPDNANILASNGKLSRDQVDTLQSYKPSPAKPNLSRLTSGTFSGPSTSGSGAKQIQDGKRLVAAAGKLSSRLLAKGKDKLRTASAGDKVDH